MFGRDLSQAVWCKSSFSEPNGGECIEVAFQDDAVALRDSKNPTGPVLTFPAAEWRAFLGGVAAGEFTAP